jgi:hypothetical protein
MLSRMKFEIEQLVADMLDQLPSSIWTSPTTTFFDPAIGGGQFVRAVEQRLRACGHSDSNIHGRVFGFEESDLHIRFAVNKYKLVGQYHRKPYDKFLEMDDTMKFDVVIGNPPFKNGNETGGKSSLWRKIVAKAWTIVKDNGMLVMVAPQFPNSANDLGHIFTQNQTNTVWTKISQHFPGVGSSFFAWSVTKKPKTTDTLFINDGIRLDVTSEALPNDLRSISILQKVLAHDKFECKSSPEYLHTSVADGKDDDHLYSKPTKKHPYIVRRTSGDNYQMYGAVKPTDYDLPKVVMTFSGNPHYKYHDKNEPIGTIKFQSGHILVKNKTEGDNLIRLYESALYRYIQNQMSSGGMRGKNFYELPKMDLTRTWTDEELFSHFGLTDEEVALVTGTI